MAILDDLKLIAARDGGDALGVAGKQLAQLKQVFDLPSSDFRPRNVVVAGMGGSALAAQIVSSWPALAVPYEIVRGYDIPAYVNENTLFVASSYSGDTEETLSALEQATKAGAQVAIVASGGQLAEIASAKSYSICKLPGGLQPRMAVLYNLKALMSIFASYGLVGTDVLGQLETTADKLADLSQQWAPDVTEQRNQAKQLASKILGKTPIIYAGPKLYPVAYKWKIDFNEMSKNTAWSNFYSEFDHNEFIGWTSHPVEKPFQPINLISNLENPRILKRFELSDKLLSGRRPAPLTIEVVGDSLLEQILSTMMLGDFVSIYLAILNSVDPTPVELIEKLKRLLGS